MPGEGEIPGRPVLRPSWLWWRGGYRNHDCRPWFEEGCEPGPLGEAMGSPRTHALFIQHTFTEVTPVRPGTVLANGLRAWT